MNFTNEDVQKFISENKMCIVYFSGKSCGACLAIKQKLLSILKDYDKLELIDIDGEINTSIAAANGVFSVPVGILYVEGKETIRFGRNVDLLDLEKNIDRYYKMIFESN